MTERIRLVDESYHDNAVDVMERVLDEVKSNPDVTGVLILVETSEQLSTHFTAHPNLLNLLGKLEYLKGRTFERMRVEDL